MHIHHHYQSIVFTSVILIIRALWHF